VSLEEFANSIPDANDITLDALDKCRQWAEKMTALTDETGRFYIDLPASATPETIALFEANGFKVIPKPVPQGYYRL
jgi:hypothetical protein